MTYNIKRRIITCLQTPTRHVRHIYRGPFPSSKKYVGNNWSKLGFYSNCCEVRVVVHSLGPCENQVREGRSTSTVVTIVDYNLSNV